MGDINNLPDSNSATPQSRNDFLSFIETYVVSALKTTDFFSSVASDDQDVISITETWLPEDVDTLELFDDRHLVFRSDYGSSTNSCRGGSGFLIAIKKCLSPCILDLLDCISKLSGFQSN
ncbi:hypothetical protein AVEN_127568-1 [Araneus ventricosus]|uniref:Endonuclease/exonuclease/phosphatase domain-containing protein n=1 Tax=Araneus ventricosus TaxID=182803 RepID=A0A4Y2RJ83_ARAVE|nr:hypothetical protein AVEN_127568-1 [Araneus ventricosus]